MLYILINSNNLWPFLISPFTPEQFSATATACDISAWSIAGWVTIRQRVFLSLGGQGHVGSLQICNRTAHAAQHIGDSRVSPFLRIHNQAWENVVAGCVSVCRGESGLWSCMEGCCRWQWATWCWKSTRIAFPRLCHAYLYQHLLW